MFKLVALAVAGLLWSLWLFAKLRECDGEPLKIVFGQLSRLGWFNRTMILLFVVQLTMFGGAKHGTNDVDAAGGGTNDVETAGGGGETNAPPLMGMAPLTSGQESASPLSRIAPEDYDNGYVLYRVETNGTFVFSAPEGAAVATNWMLRGAATDYLRIPLGEWSFPFRDVDRTNLTAFADGTIRFAADAELPPFVGSVGIVPQANWGLLDETNRPSVFWWSCAGGGTWRFTWQNALADRCATNPVSYQVELRRNGDFIRRIGTTALHYAALVREDRTDPDRDGDGLTTEGEIFDLGTDPGLYDTDGDGLSDGEEVRLAANPSSRDTDGDRFADATDPHLTATDSWDDADADGLPDAWKNGWFGEDAVVSLTDDPGQDGINNLNALLMGVNPLASGTNGFVETSVAKPVNLNAWVIAPSAFSFDCPEGTSNLIVRTFAIERVSPWQHYFVSSCPNRAEGWQGADILIEWSTDGNAGIVPIAAADSFRIPLGTNDVPRTMMVRVRASGPHPSLSRPLYLLRWTPHLGFSPSYNVYVFNQDRQRIAVRPDPETGAYALPFSLDHGGYPHRGGIDADVAACLALPPVDGLGMAKGGFSVTSPRAFDLPPEGVEPSRQLIFYELTVGSSAQVPSGPRASQYDSPYPLDSKSLRRSYQENHHETTAETVTVTVLPDIPELGYVDLSPRLMRGLLGASGSVRAPGAVGPAVNGEPCTNDTHHVERTPDGADPEPEDEDNPKGCECNNDGTSFGSFRIRVSFGEPGREEISGYLWAQIDSPTLVHASTFNILGKGGVLAVTNDMGDVEISCSDANGRHISVENVANGVDVYVRLASGELDSIWQVRNPEGDATTIRARRLTHLLNATVDETYAIRHDDEGRVLWVQTDNITGVRREKIEFADPNEPAFVFEELERTYLAERQIREETRTYERIGEGRSAVRRLATASGWDERGHYSEGNTYYCDAAHAYRHGKLRSCRSDRKAWAYYDYDSQGRETVRIEQMDGSSFPDLGEVVLGAILSTETSAKITLSAYNCAAADSDDRNDTVLPRLVETYVRKNGGKPVLVSRTGRTCTREYDSRRIPVRRIVTTEGFGAAVRTSTHREYPEDTAVPAVLRGMEIYSEEPDGSVVETEYEISNSFVIATARTSFNGNYRKIYTVTVSDAAFGNVVREETRLMANDAVIEWTNHSYDDRQRRRSSVYSDGTSETNAYSCCRLLWSRDREGRRTLRSARTGTDSLYNADEEVWRSGMSYDGDFRVTQHFFDGLGRETNTVTFAGYLEGEAVDPVTPTAGQHPIVRTTEYFDDGLCRESSTTDERGAVIDQWEYSSESSVESCSRTAADEKTLDESRTTYRGGRTETYRYWDGKWTLQTAETHYDSDGCRVDVRLTESSDYGTVTNSVIVYDPLGRIASSFTPLGSSVFAYDGATTRVLTETVTAGDVVRVRTCLYDDCGEEIGIAADGVTERSDVTYEEASNVWWRVTAESTTCENGTNAMTITREQLTGLGDGLRERVITDVIGGEKSCKTVAFNYGSGIATETLTSSAATPVVSRKVYGIETSRTAEGETLYSWYDAFGHETYTERDNGIEWHPGAFREYNAVGDLIIQSVFTNYYWDALVECYEYDALGNRISTVRANGEEVLSAYDAQGNLVSEGGATYPVRYDYDTENRRVAMRTTRDGETWDETRWTYDPATGLCTSKRRADGTTVNYTYTPDGLPEQTTRSNGHWVRNVYDAARQVVGVETDDGDDVTFVRDPFGRETSAANAVAAYGYALDICGVATNETAAVGGATCAIRRAVDADGRRIALDADGVEQFVGYRADGKIGTVSNADAVVTYAYTEDEKDAGHTLVVSGGATFVREVIRDGFRRELVTRVENGIGADFSYGFDALGRPVSRNGDSFAYNAHGEVSGAWTAGNAEAYAYDEIGNLLISSANAETNRYVSNCLNQYTEINRTIEQSEQSNNPVYDAEGNLTQYGEWSYTYDAQNRLATVSSNGLLVASNFYDHMGRRVRMVTSEASYTFIYDGWNLVLEVAERGGETERTEYYWGKDISGTLQGAGGIGGLLYLKRNGTIFVPICDAYGNVMEYRAANGSLVASYAYDAFGRTIVQTGSLADTFRHRHATKFYESETGFYYYGHRHYVPSLARWLTTDPIEEDGGLNLYAFCANNALSRWDALGEFGMSVTWDSMSCTIECYKNWNIDWEAVIGPVIASALRVTNKMPVEHRGMDITRVGWKTTDFSRTMGLIKQLAFEIEPHFPKVSAKLVKYAMKLRDYAGKISSPKIPSWLGMVARFATMYDACVFLHCSDKCCDKSGLRFEYDF